MPFKACISEEYRRGNCSFRAPSDYSDVEYWIVDGQVVDETGAAVDGVEPWDDGGDASVCGILIQSMEDHHGESPDLDSLAWEIRIQFKDGGIHGQKNLHSITVEIHLRDENILFPELQRYLGMTPLHYDLSLVPELLDTNDTIRFSGSVKVTHLSNDFRVIIHFTTRF